MTKKGLGYCPFCSNQIFKIKKDRVIKPLGNYRSIKFYMVDGGHVTVPMCDECHDPMTAPVPDSFYTDLHEYLKNCAPAALSEKAREKYAGKISTRKVEFIAKKLGALKKQDLENGAKIWRY